MIIREIEPSERSEALSLVWDVFMQYEAPDYSKEGIETFRRSVIDNRDYLDNLTLYGAYADGGILGVIATRNSGNHVALFFVDGKHHRKGVGRRLFEMAAANSTAKEITVHSSPYATEVYHHLGFVDTDIERETDGMRYTPMVYVKDVTCT